MKNNQVISFDIYDTLIERVLPVEKIYKILSRKYGISNFSNIRKEAELKAKKKYSYNYTIYEIYEFINVKEKEKILEDEIKYEIENTTKNQIGEKIYNELKGKNTLICVSDMYFTKEILQEMLLKNGYTEIKKIYVSCEYRASKRNMKIFEIVKKDFKDFKITHIGDSIRSDCINPILTGLKTKYIGKNDKNNYAKTLNKDDYLYYIGYKIYGPLIFEFCLWLNFRKGNNKLLFLSREGELIKECYNKLFDVNENVFYVSRKSVIIGIFYKMIKSKSLNEIFKIIMKNRIETIEELLEKINIISLKEIIGKDLLRSKANDENINKLITIIYANEKNILSELYEKNKIFDEYINNYFSTNTILVDVGWNGSMQNLLNMYLQLSNKKVKGLYLGCLNCIEKDGFIFNKKGKEGYTILNYSGILELIFMPSHGSVISYNKTTNNIKPIFDNSEFTKESEQSIKHIQDGFLKYIDDRKRISLLSLYDKQELIELINKIGLKPSMYDLEYFGNIDFYDNGKTEKLLDKKGKFYKSFMVSEWKIGYLKKFLKIPFPYNEILLLLRRGTND